MSVLKGKKILLGITGSIAAYKAAILVRLLAKEGAEVKVVMTSFAKEFITPLTLATLSRYPIMVEFYNPENGDWNSHVAAGMWADAYLIAPATANTIAKMATGVADNLLLTTYLSARCPVFVAPAMDYDMFQHPATQQNIETLHTFGNHIVEPESGELASGLNGKGRMAEPENIVAYLVAYFTGAQTLQGRSILLTAGPTFEPIDPVRFIGNFSTGKMGYAIAEELAQRGAKVTLISGPTSLKTHHPSIARIDLQTAEEMYMAAIKQFPNHDAAILTAAVADFSVDKPSDIKIKREGSTLNLQLKATKDIAAKLGQMKTAEQLLVGFALESDNELANATRKLKEKKLDFIVLNSLRDKGAGFAVDTNKVTILDKNGSVDKFELKLKEDVAKDIVDKLQALYLSKQ